MVDKPRLSPASKTLLVVVLVLCVAPLALWLWRNAAVASHWSSMEEEVQSLLAQAHARSGIRPVLRGEPVPGKAWEKYDEAIGLLRGYQIDRGSWRTFPDASFVCGWALLRRLSSAFLAASTAGGIIVADALVSIVLIGPQLWRTVAWQIGLPLDRIDGQELGVAVSRLLLYGFQVLFWPYAAARVMKDQEAAGIRRAYADHTRSTVIASFFVCGLMSLVVQMWAKAVLFRLV